jgi:hypothetical protein
MCVCVCDCVYICLHYIVNVLLTGIFSSTELPVANALRMCDCMYVYLYFIWNSLRTARYSLLYEASTETCNECVFICMYMSVWNHKYFVTQQNKSNDTKAH